MNSLQRRITIIACISLSTVLGSIHAFSVFIPQWELIEGATRAGVSLIYSLSLISLTLAVLFGYHLYQRLSPSVIVACVGLLAALGLQGAASGMSLIWLYISYGLIFGAANGLGYGFVLQLSGHAVPERRGLAMGLVTAFYAVGATAAPVLFSWLIARGGNTLALKVVSMIVLVVALVSAAMIRWTDARYHWEPASSVQALSSELKRIRALLWIAYGSAVAAGLMILGHAYSISRWMHLQHDTAIWATTVVAFFNMLGGFTAGYFADRISSRLLLHWLPLVSSLGLILLLWPFGTASALVFAALSLIGYSYGAIIAVYPVVVADIFGSLAAPKIYGQVFTAWGLAGLLGPWSSGWLFDLSGSYSLAILIGVLLSAVSISVIRYSRQ